MTIYRREESSGMSRSSDCKGSLITVYCFGAEVFRMSGAFSNRELLSLLSLCNIFSSSLLTPSKLWDSLFRGTLS